MSFRKSLELYLRWKASYAPKAAVTYRLHLERLGEWVKWCPVETITLDQVLRFKEKLDARFAPANVAYSMIVFKNFFRYLKESDVKVLPPFLLKIPKYTPQAHVAVTEEEYKELRRVYATDEYGSLRRHLVIRLLWDTGMRVSEVCAMNVADIDPKKTMAYVITKKNRQIRWVMWSKETHQLLLRYLGIRLCENTLPPLFVGLKNPNAKRNSRISERGVQRWIEYAVQAADIHKKITPHSFRHGKAHKILAMGGNPKHIQAILGHAEGNPVAAFSYLRLDDREFEKIAARFVR